MNEQAPLFEQEQPNGISIGAPVRWTEVRNQGGSFSMTVHDGTVIHLYGPLATVRTQAKKTRVVPITDLRTPEQPTVLDEYFKAGTP